MRNVVLVSALTAFVVAVLATVVFGTGEKVVERVVEERTLGLQPSEITNLDALSVKEFTQGGGVNSIATTGTSYTLTAADLEDYSVISFTPNTGATTLTLPATSTWDVLVPDAGDMRVWVVENATSTATNVTLAAGTGIDLQEPDGQNVVLGQNNYAWVTCFREASTNVVCRVDETVPAD